MRNSEMFAKLWLGRPPTQEKSARSRALHGPALYQQSLSQLGTLFLLTETFYCLHYTGELRPAVCQPPQHQKLCSVTSESLKMFLPQPSETCQNCNYKLVKFR